MFYRPYPGYTGMTCDANGACDWHPQPNPNTDGTATGGYTIGGRCPQGSSTGSGTSGSGSTSSGLSGSSGTSGSGATTGTGSTT